MVKRKLNKNQTKLGIKTLDWNVPANHISRFVVEFVEEVFSTFKYQRIQEKERKRLSSSRFNVKTTYLC